MDTGNADESLLSHDLNGLQNPESIAAFLEATFDAVVAFDSQERITYWNPAAAQMYGWTAREAIGKTPAELFWPLNTPQEKKSHKERQLSLKRGAMLWGEHDTCRKDGSSLWVQYAIRAVFDTGGKLSGYLALYRDISIQARLREKEEELKRSNQKLNEILASIQDDFYVISHDWVFVYANRQFASKLGKEPKDFVGNNVWEMFPKHVGLALGENFHAAMEKREMRRFEIPGQYTNAWYGITVFPSSEGITVLGTDITERKRTEQALAQALQELHAHLDNSPLGIVVFDPEFRITEWSAGAESMFGWRAEEVLGKTIAELRWVHEEDAQRVARLSADMLAGRKLSNVHANRNYRKDGSVVECEWYNSALLDENGKLISVRSQILNVTKRKRAEEALLESQKELQLLNETLEQKVQKKTTQVRRLASDLIKATQRERQRISHILHDDLQQRIYAIRMQLSFLRDELPQENETTRQEASDIERQLDEIRRIIRNLSIDLSPPILPEEGLSHAVNWLTAQMQQQYGLLIELHADGPFTIPNEELHVLLFNCIRELLFNVVKHAQAGRAVVTLQWSDTDLRIEVRDDGQGFSVGMLEQQMSEEDSLPSSYGLPTIRHQLNLFDGRMEIKSESGVGTQVTLIIPIAKIG